MSTQPKNPKFQQGTIKRHPDGFGFFIPDDPNQPDVYVSKNHMIGIMTNDRVMVEIFPERGGDRFRGEIQKVISRGVKKVVGEYQTLNEHWGIVKDDGRNWGDDLRIRHVDSKNAKAGQLVVAEIIEYAGDKTKFTGKIVEVLGHPEDPLLDVKKLLISHHIPTEFSPATLKEAKSFTEHVDPKDFAGREDIRKLDLITIDGATAKDFDDAVYAEQNQTGFRCIVAIADVSHYVIPGNAIDRDAFERGTSVYFPNFVVPMLPEVLSNGLCSLNPHVPRLCLVADMQFDFTGTMTSSKFYEAVMESKARVTYGEAQEIIDGGIIEKFKHVKENIMRCNDLAKILMAKRFREGSLDLEIPETQIVLDGAGNTVDIIKSERLFAHRLIEELMLAANIAVAKFLSEKEIPSVYRIHEAPFEDAIYMLERYLHNFGSKQKLQGGTLQKRLTRALQEFAGKPEATILNILTLRSMQQAKYSPNNVGHFGLGFEFYTHFTSPIRRYPDLIVHRLLKSQIMPKSRYKTMSENDVATATALLSACEQRAAKSERQFQAIKKARLMSKHIGSEFDGIISSITKFGIFVLLRAFDVDGLIRLEFLGKEKFEFNEERLELVGTRSGFRYCLGDSVKIRVVKADVELGQIDFELSSLPAHELRAHEPAKDKRHLERLAKLDQKFRANKGMKRSSDRPGDKKRDSSSNGKTDRKDSQKRGKASNDSKRVRKARVSSSRGANKAR